jgi:Flp pilus assembly protein CpaB
MVFRRAMPLSSKIFAVLAAVLGASAFLLVRAERDRYAALSPAIGPPVTVILTRFPLPRGAVLSTADLETTRVPRAFAQPKALSSIDEAVGRVLSGDVAAGEQLTRTRLVASEVGPLAGLVPEGMRAITIAAPIPDGLASGDRIDVLATYGGEGRFYTETVGFALEVLKIVAPGGGAFAPAGEGGSTVIVLASPDVVERLATASALATVHVALIGPDAGPALPSSAPVSG